MKMIGKTSNMGGSLTRQAERGYISESTNTNSRKARIQRHRDIAEFPVVSKLTVAFPRKVATAETTT
jgi:hypothetical protein